MLFRLILCGIALYGSTASAQDALSERSTLLIVSEAWEGATNEDGSGFYWELVRLIYEPVGYRVEIRTVPYARAVNLVRQGQADGWLGAYLDEEDFAIFPQQHYDADRVSALVYAPNFPIWEGKSSLEGKLLGWINQYQYEEYLEVSVVPYRLTSRRSGVLMLERGRLDALLDADSELKIELERLSTEVDAQNFHKHFVMDLPLYPAFANNQRGESLAYIWDQRLKLLHESGELRPFYQNAGYTEIYPFDDALPD